jgi:imidazoleglycerol phosphate dehydratase HisB
MVILLSGVCWVQDLSGRPHLSFNLEIPTERIGTFDTQLVEHFFQSLVNTSGMTLHIRCFSHLPGWCLSDASQ